MPLYETALAGTGATKTMDGLCFDDELDNAPRTNNGRPIQDRTGVMRRSYSSFARPSAAVRLAIVATACIAQIGVITCASPGPLFGGRVEPDIKGEQVN